MASVTVEVKVTVKSDAEKLQRSGEGSGNDEGSGCNGASSEKLLQWSGDAERGDQDEFEAVDGNNDGWLFADGDNATTDNAPLYVVTHCKQNPSVIGIHCGRCCNWSGIERRLPGGKFIGSGAKLKRFEDRNEAVQFFELTRRGSKPAQLDGKGLSPRWFCNCCGTGAKQEETLSQPEREG